MSRKHLKPRDKVTQRMTRDGVVLENQCQRRCDFVIFRRTRNVRKRRVKVCSL